jgi:hypothetical protein
MSSTIEVRFSLEISKATNKMENAKGAAFHRWLPTGELDAIQLHLPKPTDSLKVWFERTGQIPWFHDDVLNIASADDPLLDQIGLVYSGPLHVHCRFLTSKTKDSDIADHVSKEIFPPVAEVIKRLRLQFGQWWLSSELPSMASSNQAALFQTIGATVSVDGAPSRPLVPGTPVTVISATVSPDSAFRSYISKADWDALLSDSPLRPIDQDEAMLLDACLRASKALAAADHRAALIYATTAAEFSLELAEDRAPPEAKEAIGRISGENHRLAQRIAAAAGILGGFEPAAIQLAFRGVELRNNLIHKNADLVHPTAELSKIIRALIDIAARLGTGSSFRTLNILLPRQKKTWE